MAATDIDRLTLPREARSALEGSRETRIREHTIRIDPQWWHDALASHGLPGAPIRSSLSRGDLFELASDLDSDEGVLRLLWGALAWGSGTTSRNNYRRISSVARDRAQAAALLREAALLSSSDPVAAYARLRPRGAGAVKYLGPAFFTKFCYFAGAGRPDHPCAILDARVARALKSYCGWESLGSYGWPARTYGRYCDLLARWAREESEPQRPGVAVDEIERWLFDSGAQSEPNRRSALQQ